jgi:hypothetical protein
VLVVPGIGTDAEDPQFARLTACGKGSGVEPASRNGRGRMEVNRLADGQSKEIVVREVATIVCDHSASVVRSVSFASANPPAPSVAPLGPGFFRLPYIRWNPVAFAHPGRGATESSSMSLLTPSIESPRLTRWNFGLFAMTLLGVLAIAVALMLPNSIIP